MRLYNAQEGRDALPNERLFIERLIKVVEAERWVYY